MSEVPNGKKMMADEKIADGEEALSVLEYSSTRTQFINELIEVSFLEVLFFIFLFLVSNLSAKCVHSKDDHR